ncbi:MAG TPA: aminoacyl-tRNA hydrolase [Candidatus Competibacteraceae bacterium]|nr:aminoacyl-tRNA hydrolase [Candidatus Competibacteraceae bacterium]
MSGAPSALQLVVGLGNPGPEYQDTRHNAGFWFVDELARQHGGRLRIDSKYSSEVGQISIGSHGLWLLKPLTYMNRSGQAIARFASFYKIPRPAILVVHDELDLPPGVARLKRDGGHGGHNGLRDAIAQLGGHDFQRLRLGIGHPGDARMVVDYVLRKPPLAERQLIEQAMDEALRVFPQVAQGQLEKAMQALHSTR